MLETAQTPTTKKGRKVTVVDVARAAGVCQATVSAALHGRGRVGESRRREIKAIAQELGYEPQSAAQLLRAAKTNQIGLIVAADDMAHAFANEMPRLVLGYFVQQCNRRDTRYVIEFHHHAMDEDGTDFTPPHQVISRLVDGTILLGDVGEPLRRWMNARVTHPWVSIEEPAEFSVLSAADEGITLAMRQLIEGGHRRFAYCGGPRRYTQQRLGAEAFEAAVTGVDAAPFIQQFAAELNEATMAVVYAWARSVLVRPDRPTAFVCHGECLARAVIHAASELGLRVPGDLSVVGYGSRFEAERRYPMLTTVANDYEAITAHAMDLLHWRIDKYPVEMPVRRVLPHLIHGDTVGPVPAVIKSIQA